jgi:hypothetical protein
MEEEFKDEIIKKKRVYKKKKPSEPDIPKFKKKVVRKKKVPKVINLNELIRNSNVQITEEEVKRILCDNIRAALDINLTEKTILESMESNARLLENSWDELGEVVLPYVLGGITVEGQQSIIKHSFTIGYFLGSLKEKNTNDINNFDKLMHDIKFD